MIGIRVFCAMPGNPFSPMDLLPLPFRRADPKSHALVFSHLSRKTGMAKKRQHDDDAQKDDGGESKVPWL